MESLKKFISCSFLSVGLISVTRNEYHHHPFNAISILIFHMLQMPLSQCVWKRPSQKSDGVFYFSELSWQKRDKTWTQCVFIFKFIELVDVYCWLKMAMTSIILIIILITACCCFWFADVCLLFAEIIHKSIHCGLIWRWRWRWWRRCGRRTMARPIQAINLETWTIQRIFRITLLVLRCFLNSLPMNNLCHCHGAVTSKSSIFLKHACTTHTKLESVHQFIYSSLLIFYFSQSFNFFFSSFRVRCNNEKDKKKETIPSDDRWLVCALGAVVLIWTNVENYNEVQYKYASAP